MAILVGIGEEMGSVLIESASLGLPHFPALQRLYLVLRDLNAVELTYLWRSSHYKTLLQLSHLYRPYVSNTTQILLLASHRTDSNVATTHTAQDW